MTGDDAAGKVQMAVDHVGSKVAGSVGLASLAGVTTWAEASSIASFVAATLAAVYSACTLSEWLWKRFGRPFCEARGWVARKKFRRSDYESSDE